MKQWYEQLFDNYSKKYDNESFTQGTTGECDFIEEEISHNKSIQILDVGCGTGRHSIELSKRGYLVKGIDLSQSQIDRAIEKSKGKLIFTTLNGLFPLFHSVKEFINSGAEKGQTSGNTFDLLTFRDYSVYETKDDSGNRLSLKCNERCYVPSEISWLVKSLGFTKVQIYGAKLGQFSRSDALTTEDYEMLVIAERQQ